MDFTRIFWDVSFDSTR